MKAHAPQRSPAMQAAFDQATVNSGGLSAQNTQYGATNDCAAAQPPTVENALKILDDIANGAWMNASLVSDIADRVGGPVPCDAAQAQPPQPDPYALVERLYSIAHRLVAANNAAREHAYRAQRVLG